MATLRERISTILERAERLAEEETVESADCTQTLATRLLHVNRAGCALVFAIDIQKALLETEQDTTEES